MKRRGSQVKVGNSKKTKKSSKKVNNVEAGGGVVTVDPFLVSEVEGSKVSCYPEDSGDQIVKKVKVENSGNFSCCWELGLRGKCTKVLDSPDDLIQHLLNDHANFGTRGYVCNWAGCEKRRGSHFTSHVEFEEHLKFHAVIAPFSAEIEDNDEDGAGCDDSDDNSFVGSNVSCDDSDTDYSDTDESDEDYGSAKKKTKKNKGKDKKAGSISVSSASNAAAKVKVPVAKIAPSNDYSSVALSFYRFTCLWEVCFILKTMRSDGKPQTVSCQRKFTVLEESIDHLHHHHLAKMATQEEPLICCWKDCKTKDKVFDSMEELKEHVIVHTEEKMITYANNLAENTKREPLARVIPIVRKSSPSLSAAPPAIKAVVSVKPTPSSHAKDQPELPVVSGEKNLSWMVAPLRFLLAARVSNFQESLCPPSRHCYVCRFYSLKNRLAAKDTPMPYAMFEFTELTGEFESCDQDPMRFMAKFLADAGSHEAFHGKSVFGENFWTKVIGEFHRGCVQHTLKRNLINLFHVMYKDCATCAIEAEHWPSDSHQNVIIDLGADERIYYPGTLAIKGKIYQLGSVVCQDSANARKRFYTHVRLANKWVTFNDNSSGMATNSLVFRDRNARIVLYVAKETTHGSLFSGTIGESYTLDECRELPSRNTGVHEDRDQSDSRFALVRREPGNEHQSPEGHFAGRRLLSDGSNSCFNSVIQALLASSLPTVVKNFCFSGEKCYFCRMQSLIQSVALNAAGTVVDPFQLLLHKEDLGISDEHWNPATALKSLILEIVSDERKQHETSDVKYKFMIRFKKKSCGCLQSLEAYQWTVSPSKKNESLFDLMTQCTVKCTECNVMTAVRPIHMPENLIITIDRQEGNKDTSVHFPDEWAVHSTRYFLASIIVDDPACDKESAHYLAYCKVFGKWIRYNDSGNSMASSCDVLGNKQACVLVYVEKELTSEAVQRAIEQARSFKEKSRASFAPAEIIIKQEPMDG